MAWKRKRCPFADALARAISRRFAAFENARPPAILRPLAGGSLGAERERVSDRRGGRFGGRAPSADGSRYWRTDAPRMAHAVGETNIPKAS